MFSCRFSRLFESVKTKLFSTFSTSNEPKLDAKTFAKLAQLSQHALNYHSLGQLQKQAFESTLTDLLKNQNSIPHLVQLRANLM